MSCQKSRRGAVACPKRERDRGKEAKNAMTNGEKNKKFRCHCSMLDTKTLMYIFFLPDANHPCGILKDSSVLLGLQSSIFINSLKIILQL